MTFARTYSDAQLAELQRRHLAGETLMEIAYELGLSPDAICKVFRRHGLKRRGRGRKTVFTPEVLKRAKDLYDQGLSLARVAGEMGVNPYGLASAWRLRRIPCRTRAEVQKLALERRKAGNARDAGCSI